MGLVWVPWSPTPTPRSPTGPRTPPPPARQKAMQDQILPPGSHSGEVSQTSVHGLAWPGARCSIFRCPYFP